MELSKKMNDALNAQINEEMFSSYLYLAMAAHYRATPLEGLAAWFEVQAQEETAHAMKFYKYINERGGKVVFQEIKKPKATWKNPLQAFEETLTHERHITAAINALYELALKEKDYATQIFLQWFIKEQVEEEENATAIVDKLKMIGDSANGLFMLDKALGKRGEQKS